MLFLALLVAVSLFSPILGVYHIQRCCIDWVEPCKCPRLYITEDLRPCGSEILITDLKMPVARFQVSDEVRLHSYFYTVVFLLTNRLSGSIEGLRFRLMFARINIPRDRFVGILADSVEDNIIAYDYGRNTVFDELSTFRFTTETVPPDSLTSLTAFLISQSSYLDFFKVNFTGLPADRIILRRELAYMFPGEPIAAASHSLSAQQALEAGAEVTSDSRLTMSQDVWIPEGTTEGVDITDAETGGRKIKNHFHEWFLGQRNMTV
ncbi:conserved hypothetical protein [Echinococcus multilocularis]|uniref:Uncharacterized protein n=1 Tax=Echinococcus multilocularis TaxID=6211 RepID=A0A068Y117_ECHMU|nr:conserved hypothetical protein [Echinococcus multilocularis]